MDCVGQPVFGGSDARRATSHMRSERREQPRGRLVRWKREHPHPAEIAGKTITYYLSHDLNLGDLSRDLRRGHADAVLRSFAAHPSRDVLGLEPTFAPDRFLH